MTDTLERIVQEHMDRESDNDEIIGGAVFGSYARDHTTEHNDLDLLFIVNGDWRKHDIVVENDIAVELFYESVEWCDWALQSSSWWYYVRRYIKNDVRFEEGEVFCKLARIAEMARDDHLPLPVSERKAIQGYLWNWCLDIERESGLQQRFVMWKCLDYVLDQIYLLNDQMPVKDNFKIKGLKNIDSEAHQLAIEFAEANSTSREQETLDQLIDIVVDEVGPISPEMSTPKQPIKEREPKRNKYLKQI